MLLLHLNQPSFVAQTLQLWCESAMEYSHIKFSSFSGSTTCYSGLGQVSTDGSGYLATESELIQVSAEANDAFCCTLPEITKDQSGDVRCVGHACLHTQQVFIFLQKDPPTDIDHYASVVMNSSIMSELHFTPTQSHDPSISDGSVVLEATDNGVPSLVSADEDVAHNSYASIIVWKDGATCLRISVPCRLLAPTFSKVDENEYILWVGSADDSELRCFHIVNREIRDVKVDTLEAVTSPIMTIDCCSDNDQHSIAVGCQDGTVCIMPFACRRVDDRITLEILRTHSDVVDGPIMSLHLTKTRALVGSMCGYVCQFVFTNDVWGEPSMVVKDCLWDARYEANDTVLAVHYWMDRVVLGTYSGLLQVHVPVGTTYNVEWSCRFPDAVHAIVHYDNKLIVTTRTSLHVVQAKSPMISSTPEQASTAESAGYQ